MLLAAAIFLFGATLISASKQSFSFNSESRIKTSSVKTGTHCIDYEDFVYSDSTKAISYDNSSRRFGAVDCLFGDIVLAGTYINLGDRISCRQVPSTLSVCKLCLTDYLSRPSTRLHAQVFITLDHMELEGLSKRPMEITRIG